MIEGTLGELSIFHGTFGYYADGVSPDTATLPPGWEDRLIPLHNEDTGGATGWCLDPHDLTFSKLAARREKDLAYVEALLRHRRIRPSILERLVESVGDPDLRDRISEAFRLCRTRSSG